jgi:hypothetical protein
MHSLQPRTKKRAVVFAVIWIATTICALAWLGHIAISHLFASFA